MTVAFHVLAVLNMVAIRFVTWKLRPILSPTTEAM